MDFWSWLTQLKTNKNEHYLTWLTEEVHQSKKFYFKIFGYFVPENFLKNKQDDIKGDIMAFYWLAQFNKFIPMQKKKLINFWNSF